MGQFRFNRHDPDRILEEWIAADKESEVNIDVSEPPFTILIEDKPAAEEAAFVEFLSRIREFDNMVQVYCETVYNLRKMDISNYMVALAWLSVAADKIVMGYFGECVNIELRAVCKKENGRWENTEIYYQ